MKTHYAVTKDDGAKYSLPQCRAAYMCAQHTDDVDLVTCKVCLRLLKRAWSEGEVLTDQSQRSPG